MPAISKSLDAAKIAEAGERIYRERTSGSTKQAIKVNSSSSTFPMEAPTWPQHCGGPSRAAVPWIPKASFM